MMTSNTVRSYSNPADTVARTSLDQLLDTDLQGAAYADVMHGLGEHLGRILLQVKGSD